MTKKYLDILEKYQISRPKEQLTRIDWKADQSCESSILFYKFNDHSSVEIENFQKRILNSKYGLCITNSKNLDLEGTHLSDEEFKNIKKELLNVFYPFDFTKMSLVGITGTNGKTTTVDLIRQLCMKNEISVLTLGTLGVYKNDKILSSFALTTPSLIDFRKIIFEHGQDVNVIALELSSHALWQNRLGDTVFNRIGWTNFTQDHLDYHKTMDDYFRAKLKILDCSSKETELFIPKDETSLKDREELRDAILCESDSIPEHPFFVAKYNQSNYALASTLLSSLYEIKTGGDLLPPPGRFNIYRLESGYIIIDYAHTPDALESICREIRLSFKNLSLEVLFGCGGNRDKSKRSLMAKAASSYADKIYITSDNPRLENPEDIIADILTGVSIEHEVIVQREEAIEKALKDVEQKVILIAGKGHEDYIEEKGVRRPYSDIDEVEKWINHVNN